MMETYCLDTNILITAWGVSYPIDVFPGLWEQLSLHKNQIILIKPVYDEIKSLKEGMLKEWLDKNKFTPVSLNESEKKRVLPLEAEYEIDPNSKGASGVDLSLISYAKSHNKPVVTLEAIQTTPPGKKSNYKIPLICKEQSVICLNFIYFLKAIGISV